MVAGLLVAAAASSSMATKRLSAETVLCLELLAELAHRAPDVSVGMIALADPRISKLFTHACGADGDAEDRRNCAGTVLHTLRLVKRLGRCPIAEKYASLAAAAAGQVLDASSSSTYMRPAYYAVAVLEEYLPASDRDALVGSLLARPPTDLVPKTSLSLNGTLLVTIMDAASLQRSARLLDNSATNAQLGRLLQLLTRCDSPSLEEAVLRVFTAPGSVTDALITSTTPSFFEHCLDSGSSGKLAIGSKLMRTSALYRALFERRCADPEQHMWTASTLTASIILDYFGLAHDAEAKDATADRLASTALRSASPSAMACRRGIRQAYAAWAATSAELLAAEEPRLLVYVLSGAAAEFSRAIPMLEAVDGRILDSAVRISAAEAVAKSAGASGISALVIVMLRAAIERQGDVRGVVADAVVPLLFDPIRRLCNALMEPDVAGPVPVGLHGGAAESLGVRFQQMVVDQLLGHPAAVDATSALLACTYVGGTAAPLGPWYRSVLEAEAFTEVMAAGAAAIDLLEDADGNKKKIASASAVLFGHERRRAAVAGLLEAAVKHDASVVSASHFPTLLLCYNASVAQSDRRLLRLLLLYEVRFANPLRCPVWWHRLHSTVRPSLSRFRRMPQSHATPSLSTIRMRSRCRLRVATWASWHAFGARARLSAARGHCHNRSLMCLIGDGWSSPLVNSRLMKRARRKMRWPLPPLPKPRYWVRCLSNGYQGPNLLLFCLFVGSNSDALIRTAQAKSCFHSRPPIGRSAMY